MRAFKLFIVVMLGAILVFAYSCKKPDSNKGSTLTLQLKANYGTQSFTEGGYNTDPVGRVIQVNNFMFYLSNINLIKSDGSKVKVSDVALIDFSNPASLTVSVNNVQGDFTGITFGCGLDSAQNASNANAISAPNPLSEAYNMSWSSIMQYRFEVLDGKWDDSIRPIMRNGFSYHMGTNPAYRITRLSKAFSVANTPYTLDLNLDVEKIFYNNVTNDSLSIKTYSQWGDNPGDSTYILQVFPANFSNAFNF